MENNFQPEMFGERIWLRPIELRDALAIAMSAEFENDPHLPEPAIPVSETAFRNWIASRSENELVWAVCRADEQEAIGTASIRNIDLHARTAETGMGLFSPADRGKGLGQEIKTLVLDFAFDVIGLHSLNCTVDSRNTRSQRSVERSGYVLAGKLSANIPIGLGQYADTLVYQIMAADWRARKANP